MKLKLPILGEVRTGKDLIEQKQVKSEEKFFDGVLGGLLDISQQTLSSEKTASTALLKANTGWVYRNNDAIAQAVSKIEFELFTVGLSGGEIVFNQIDSHPLLDLLDKPNAETVKSDAIYIIQSHKKLTGDAFWLKVRTNGLVTALRTLPPDKVSLILQPPTKDDPTVIQAYKYTDKIDGNTIEVEYDPKDIIHFKKPNPNNPFRGLGAVEAMAQDIDLDNLTIETTKSYFQKGALINFILTTDSKVTDEQLKRVRAEMRSQYTGARNAYQTMILGNGLKPSPVSMSNKDMEFLAQLEWYRDKIMVGFGNTKAAIGMDDQVNYATHDGSIIEWQRDTIQPEMESITNALNEYLVPEFGDNLVLGYVDPVPENNEDDVKEVVATYPIGVITLNEARELLDLDPMEDGTGDEVYQKPAPILPTDPSATGDANPANQKPKNPKPDAGGGE